MNNKKRKNIIYSLSSQNVLPYQDNNGITVKSDQILFTSINHAMKKMIQNDIYNERYLNGINNYDIGPLPYSYQELYDSPSNTKMWSKGFKYDDIISIYHKIDSPISECTFPIDDLSGLNIKFIDKIYDRYITGTDKGLYFSTNGEIWSKSHSGIFSELNCMAIYNNYEDKQFIIATGNGIYTLTNYSELDDIESTLSSATKLHEGIGNVNTITRIKGEFVFSTDKGIVAYNESKKAKWYNYSIKDNVKNIINGPNNIAYAIADNGLYSKKSIYGLTNIRNVDDTRDYYMNVGKYFATSSGVVILGNDNKIEQVLLEGKQIRSVATHGDYVFIASEDGLYKYDSKNKINKKIYDGSIQSVFVKDGLLMFNLNEKMFYTKVGNTDNIFSIDDIGVIDAFANIDISSFVCTASGKIEEFSILKKNAWSKAQRKKFEDVTINRTVKINPNTYVLTTNGLYNVDSKEFIESTLGMDVRNIIKTEFIYNEKIVTYVLMINDKLVLMDSDFNNISEITGFINTKDSLIYNKVLIIVDEEGVFYLSINEMDGKISREEFYKIEGIEDVSIVSICGNSYALIISSKNQLFSLDMQYQFSEHKQDNKLPEDINTYFENTNYLFTTSGNKIYSVEISSNLSTEAKEIIVEGCDSKINKVYTNGGLYLENSNGLYNCSVDVDIETSEITSFHVLDKINEITSKTCGKENILQTEYILSDNMPIDIIGVEDGLMIKKTNIFNATLDNTEYISEQTIVQTQTKAYYDEENDIVYSSSQIQYIYGNKGLSIILFDNESTVPKIKSITKYESENVYSITDVSSINKDNELESLQMILTNEGSILYKQDDKILIDRKKINNIGTDAKKYRTSVVEGAREHVFMKTDSYKSTFYHTTCDYTELPTATFSSSSPENKIINDFTLIGNKIIYLTEDDVKIIPQWNSGEPELLLEGKYDDIFYCGNPHKQDIETDNNDIVAIISKSLKQIVIYDVTYRKVLSTISTEDFSGYVMNVLGRSVQFYKESETTDAYFIELNTEFIDYSSIESNIKIVGESILTIPKIFKKSFSVQIFDRQSANVVQLLNGGLFSQYFQSETTYHKCEEFGTKNIKSICSINNMLITAQNDGVYIQNSDDIMHGKQRKISNKGDIVCLYINNVAIIDNTNKIVEVYNIYNESINKYIVINKSLEILGINYVNDVSYLICRDGIYRMSESVNIDKGKEIHPFDTEDINILGIKMTESAEQQKFTYIQSDNGLYIYNFGDEGTYQIVDIKNIRYLNIQDLENIRIAAETGLSVVNYSKINEIDIFKEIYVVDYVDDYVTSQDVIYNIYVDNFKYPSLNRYLNDSYYQNVCNINGDIYVKNNGTINIYSDGELLPYTIEFMGEDINVYGVYKLDRSILNKTEYGYIYAGKVVQNIISNVININDKYLMTFSENGGLNTIDSVKETSEFEILNESVKKLQSVIVQDDIRLIIGSLSGIYQYDTDLNTYQKQFELIKGSEANILYRESFDIDDITEEQIVRYVYGGGNQLRRCDEFFINDENVLYSKYPIQCVYQQNSKEYFVGTLSGMIGTKYKYDLYNDFTISSYTKIDNLIEEYVNKYIKEHIHSDHQEGSLIKYINDNKIPRDLEGNSIRQNRDIKNITNNIEFSNDTKYVYASSYQYCRDLSSYDIQQIQGITYINKNMLSGNRNELYINIPTINAYYINHMESSTKCNFYQKMVYRKNVGVETESTANNNKIYLRVAIDRNHYDIQQIYNIQINGCSLPLKMYIDEDYHCDNCEKYFHSTIKDSRLIKTDFNIDGQFIYFDFICFGTDEQSILIEYSSEHVEYSK